MTLLSSYPVAPTQGERTNTLPRTRQRGVGRKAEKQKHRIPHGRSRKRRVGRECPAGGKILSVRESIEESKAALTLASDQVSAYLAFRRWIATEEGQRLWQATCPSLSWERISHALAQTSATCFGLLLTSRGAIIWSRYSHRAFTRRAPLYEEAAQTGLCFWWDGNTFARIGEQTFLDRIKTLPMPPLSNSARSRTR